METKIYKTEEAFNKAIEDARKKYEYESWGEAESTSTVFWGARYEETNEPIEPWSGTTTAVYFYNKVDDEILEALIIILL